MLERSNNSYCVKDIVAALQQDEAERRKAEAEQHYLPLTPIGIIDAWQAHQILTRFEVNHASPAGRLLFSNPLDREIAKGLLMQADPGRFAWRWQGSPSADHH